MSKIILFCLFLFVFQISSYSLDFKPIKISGETNYAQEGSLRSLSTTIILKYHFQLYEPTHKKYSLYLGGRVTTDYNHFGNQIKHNAYTVLGIDF